MVYVYYYYSHLIQCYYININASQNIIKKFRSFAAIVAKPHDC